MIVLAHAGAGASWQAAVVVAAVALVGAVALAATGRIDLEHPRDLWLPIAGVLVVTSLGPIGSSWLSDAIGWGLPVALVALAVLVLAATTRLRLDPTSPLLLGGLVLGLVGALLLHRPLTIALHPPVETIPLRDDATVTIMDPADGSVVTAGELQVRVEVSGASIGPAHTPQEELGADPEEAGSLVVYVDGTRMPVEWDAGCTVDDPCDAVEFFVALEAGERTLTVEFTRGDGAPLAPLVVDRSQLLVEAS